MFVPAKTPATRSGRVPQPRKSRGATLAPVPARPRKLQAVPNKPRSPRPGNGVVERLPRQSGLPLWLRSLIGLQRSSTIVAFALAGAALGVYGWTVYSQQLWGKEYQRLENLRRDERQLMATGSTLKSQIAQQVNPASPDLIPRTPQNVIFLKPAPLRQPPAPPQKPVDPAPAPAGPMGY